MLELVKKNKKCRKTSRLVGAVDLESFEMLSDHVAQNDVAADESSSESTCVMPPPPPGAWFEEARLQSTPKCAAGYY